TVWHRPCRRHRQAARPISAAGGRHHLRACVRRKIEGSCGGRRLAARGGLACAREPQRPCRVQRHRHRSRPCRAGAAWPSGARRLSRQLGVRAVAPTTTPLRMSSGRLRVHAPTITANYLAILALIYVALALQVIRLRHSSGAPFNDGGNEGLRGAIRAHGNFAEYVPIITLMVAFLEMSGASPL